MFAKSVIRYKRRIYVLLYTYIVIRLQALVSRVLSPSILLKHLMLYECILHSSMHYIETDFIFLLYACSFIFCMCGLHNTQIKERFSISTKSVWTTVNGKRKMNCSYILTLFVFPLFSVSHSYSNTVCISLLSPPASY